jgi:hypothetical protein
MAKIIFKQTFTLEVGEETYTGTLNDLSKSQKTEFEKISKKVKGETESLQKILLQIEKVDRRIFILEKLDKWDEILELEKEKEVLIEEQSKLISTLNDGKGMDDIFKKRLELSLDSDDKDKILAAGKEYGYQNVFNTILQDIEDNKAKK